MRSEVDRRGAELRRCGGCGDGPRRAVRGGGPRGGRRSRPRPSSTPRRTSARSSTALEAVATPPSSSTRTSAGPSPRSWPTSTPSPPLLVERYGVGPGDRVAIGMRNYPEWVIAFAAITSIGAVSVSLNAWWTDRRAGLRARGLRAPRCSSPTSSGSSAGREACRAPRLLASSPCGPPPSCPRASTAGRTCASSARPCPTSRSAPTTTPPSSTPRAPPGRPKGAVSTHRAVVQALMGFGCKTAARPPAPPAEPTARRRRAPGVHPHRPAVPRHRLRARDAVVLRQRPEAGDHVQVGRRPRPRAHRAREGHQLRRRPHPELGPARVAPVRRDRHVEPGEHRWRRRPGPARAGEAGGVELPGRRPVDRLRHDRDQRLRARQQRSGLRHPPHQHGPGHADPASSTSATPTAATSRSASGARSGSRART